MTIITMNYETMSTVIYPVVCHFDGMDFDNISMTKVVELCDKQADSLGCDKYEVFNQFMEYIRTL